MIFGKKKNNWDDTYDEEYVERSERYGKIRSRSTVWAHCIAFGLTACLLLAATGLVGGQTMFEKTLTALASPVGIVWLGLIALIYFGLLFRQSWSALMALACWILLTTFGNGFVANQLIFSLEEQHLKFNADELERLDAVFVLGGGTTTTLQGIEQVSSMGGDRVVTAARLYHQDKVNLIVCTGRQWNRVNEQDMQPHEEAARLLVSLGVPEAAIAKIGGMNTSEEMQQAVTFLEQQNLAGKRIGVVTSAWHLSRAQRLARKNGLEPAMIPADFRSQFFAAGPDLLIPSARNLELSASCIKEYLAALIGR